MKKIFAVCLVVLLTGCAHSPLTKDTGEAFSEAMRRAVEQGGPVEMSLSDYAAFSSGLAQTQFTISGIVSEANGDDAMFGLNLFGMDISIGKKDAYCYLTMGEEEIQVVFAGDPQLTDGESITVTGKLSPSNPPALVDAAVTGRDAG